MCTLSTKMSERAVVRASAGSSASKKPTMNIILCSRSISHDPAVRAGKLLPKTVGSLRHGVSENVRCVQRRPEELVVAGETH